MNDHWLWFIILAGGEGERVKPVVQQRIARTLHWIGRKPAFPLEFLTPGVEAESPVRLHSPAQLAL